MIGNSIGVQFRNYIASGVPIDAQAQAHFNRVIADGGVVPSGLSGVNAFFSAVKAIYGTSDINTAISAAYDPHYLGYKLGAGSGTTLGQAARTLYSCSGASGDVVQTTAASQPLLLAHSGVNYYWNGGVNFNYCRTPNTAANSNNGNKEIIAQVDFKSGALNVIFSKDNQGYCFFHNGTNGILTFNTTTDLAPYQNNFATVAIATNFSGWIKGTAEFSGGFCTIKFYTSNDGITYNQVGANVTVPGNNFINMSSALTLGAVNDGSCMNGKIYRATISNSIGGAPVVDFNPASYNAAISQTQWSSATGEVWTINKSSGNTFVGVLVDRTIIQGNNSTTSMSVTIAGTQPYTEYLVSAKNGTGDYVARATGNARGHNGTVLYLYNGGTFVTLASTATTRQTITYRNNGASSGIAVNNGTETTGNAGVNNGTTLVLASGAHNITTLISSLTNDSLAQRAAMFTTVKSFNNY